MVIRISEIEDAVKVTGAIEAAKFRTLEGAGDITLLEPVRYELTVAKRGDVIIVKGPIVCTLTLTCSTCLEEFPRAVEAVLDVELAPKMLMPSQSELELTGEDLDTYYYEGDEIDVDPFVYEEIILNVPMKPVCREDCKGLCDVCGANQNRGECHCSAVSYTVLGEKLKSFLN